MVTYNSCVVCDVCHCGVWVCVTVVCVCVCHCGVCVCVSLWVWSEHLLHEMDTLSCHFDYILHFTLFLQSCDRSQWVTALIIVQG